MSRCTSLMFGLEFATCLCHRYQGTAVGRKPFVEISVTSVQCAAATPERLLPPWTAGCLCPLLWSARQIGPAGLGSGAQATALTLDAVEPEQKQPPGLQAEGHILQGVISFDMTGRGAARQWLRIRPAPDRGAQPNSGPTGLCIKS